MEFNEKLTKYQKEQHKPNIGVRENKKPSQANDADKSMDSNGTAAQKIPML